MERNALIDFKQNLLDPSARLSSWTGHNCCEWHGITCDFISGMVTNIDLRNSEDRDGFINSSLGGNITSSLLHLHNLSYLDLSFNDFGGASIPHFFGMFTNLRYLNLCTAGFGGEIPSQLANLSNLNYLDLSSKDSTFMFGNWLQVQNLNWLSSLSSLQYLDLGGVDLSQTQHNWMGVVNKLSSLTELHLKNCGLSNPLQSSTGLQNLTSLQLLELSQNNWSDSSLPLWLSNLTTLTALHLSSSELHGTISLDFVTLKNLQHLQLHGNDLEGTIPQGLEKLQDLQHLDLSGNSLKNVGNQKPMALLNLCKLQFANLADNRLGGRLDGLLGRSSNCSHNNLESLDLRSNELEGEIPNSLGVLVKLQYINLSLNKLWGSLSSSSFERLDKLQFLDLAFNRLCGSLPNAIGNLSSLQYLHLSYNHFDGMIAQSFGQLSELIAFESYGNSWKGVMTEAHLVNLRNLKALEIGIDTYNEALVFNISYNWIPPFKLTDLVLRNCFVGPRFPIWLQVQTKLDSAVIIAHAGISGFIPNEWISQISSRITLLDLSNNLLEGELSQFLGTHPVRYLKLRYLYLQNNFFSGRIPHNLGDSMSQLMELILSNNNLSGNINLSSLGKMSNLKVLSLSHNQFFGQVSDDWGELKSLSVVDLANNNLHGKIPSSMGSLASLFQLILSNNNFFGEIPKSLQNCSNLQSIDFSRNRLHGSLPEWIGVVVSQLQMISLRSNLFNGTIPTHWCNLPLLRVLDLSDNNLVGQVPNCLSNWIAFIYNNNTQGFDYLRLDNHGMVTYKEKAILVTKGRELEYDTILRYVLTIDLSRNQLSGQIPYEITKFVHLGTLNLSNNELVGVIPENIGAMQNLETLDLSHNHLSGMIPTSFGSLNFLQHLNLSFNNLSGTTPISNHLQTLEDPSIYEGNPFLHISPRSKMASGENTNTLHVPIGEVENEEQDSEIFSFFISMAIGFPIGVNILFFAIFTSKSRRISYFCFVDRVSHNILEKVGILANCFRTKRS